MPASPHCQCSIHLDDIAGQHGCVLVGGDLGRLAVLVANDRIGDLGRLLFELGRIRRLQQRLGHEIPTGAELQRQRVQLGFGVLQFLSKLGIPVVAEVRFVLRRLARILLCLEGCGVDVQQRRLDIRDPLLEGQFALAERQPFFGKAVDLVAILGGKLELAGLRFGFFASASISL